jgi:TolA-binding protein
MKHTVSFVFIAGVAIALSAAGCGTTSEETMAMQSADSSSPVQTESTQGAPAPLSIDSLLVENRNLRDQVSALAAENRTLTARIGELENGASGTNSRSVPPAQEKAPAKSNRTAALQKAPQPHAAGATSYDAALVLVRKHEYAPAVEAFKELLGEGIQADLVDNCHYWMGECYYAQKRYDLAAQEFETVIEMTGADKVDDSRLMVGSCYVSLGKNDAAKRVLGELVKSSPSTPAGKRAAAKLAQLK